MGTSPIEAATATDLLRLPPLTVYVHLPWCVAKCPYCDFNSHVAPSPLPQERYVRGLLDDLEMDLPVVAGRTIEAVFFGGGTPSLFAPSSIARFLRELRARVTVAGDAEVTLEANPGTIERGRFSAYADAGVTRVSLGIQSFNDTHLKRLGRIHDVSQAQGAIAELRRSGLSNFNLDLMYGLPAQTCAEADEDLARAIDAGAAHLSHYQLTLEPGTVFFHQPPADMPDDELQWQIQESCQARLRAAGYVQYEVSAYAQSDRQCRHNLNYWRFGDYLGLGAGAHGKYTDLKSPGVWRTQRTKQPVQYLNSDALQRTERFQVASDELPFEFMLNVLRLCDGFVAEQFESRTGLPMRSMQSVLNRAVQDGLLVEASQGRWNPTSFGQRFLNDLQARFLPTRQFVDLKV